MTLALAQVKEKILIVIDGERYPRLWHFKDQIAASDSSIRRGLTELETEGVIEKHNRPRGQSYWCVPGNVDPRLTPWVSGVRFSENNFGQPLDS